MDATFTYDITIEASDTMGAISTLSPRVEICACQNGGNCTLNGLLGIDTNVVDMLCQCDQGIEQQQGQLTVALLIYCVLTHNSGWEGRYCESDKNGCSEVICFQGVECYDVPAPGSGAVCGICPSGYVGDGEKCTGIYMPCRSISLYIYLNDECLLITDVDECNGTSICMQVCINTPGSFECGCEQGYELSGTTDCIGITAHLSPL